MHGWTILLLCIVDSLTLIFCGHSQFRNGSNFESPFQTIRRTIAGSGPLFSDLTRTVIVTYRPASTPWRAAADNIQGDGLARTILANILSRNSALGRVSRSLLAAFPNLLSEKFVKMLSIVGDSDPLQIHGQYSVDSSPISNWQIPYPAYLSVNDSQGNALLDALGVFPMKSVYLRNLNMEVFEVPNSISVGEFLSVIKRDEVVQEAWYDSIIEQDPQKCGDNDLKCLENARTISAPMHFFNESSKRNLARHAPPSDPLYEGQWEHVDVDGAGINSPLAWRYWTGEKVTEKFVIALIDSGADYNHVDLRANIWRNKEEICGNLIDDDGNGYIDDCIGWDFTRDDNDPMDDNGHGTGSAGIIAAVADNSLGISPVCWGCEVMVLKALNHEIKGTVSGFIRALEYALDKKVKISNNSYGGRGSSFGALQDAIIRARDMGMIFVAAAGNYRGNNDNDRDPTYPASYEVDNIVSVAAISRDGTLAPFSSYGRTSVDIAAPGDKVTTLKPRDGYKQVDGTSFAVPFVSASAALIWSREPQLKYNEVIAIMTKYVKKLPQLAGKLKSEGTLDLYAALTRGDEGSISFKDLVSNTHPLKCQDENLCGNNAACIDTPAGRGCDCNKGYTLDSFYGCTDVDECVNGLNPCGNKVCHNLPGSYTCNCPEGYQMDGDGCNDINECQNIPAPCPLMAACVNLESTFDCRCPSGSAWNNKIGASGRCLKINYPETGPCTRNGPCSVNSLCQVAGLFWFQIAECKCIDGYIKDSSGICVRRGAVGVSALEYVSLIKAVESLPLSGHTHDNYEISITVPGEAEEVLTNSSDVKDLLRSAQVPRSNA